MGAPDTAQQLPLYKFSPEQKVLNGGDVNVSQEEATRRYNEWQSSHKPKSDYDKAFDAVRHLVPDWFLFSALIVGVITLGLVMLKVNPLLSPIKQAVIWLLKLWEKFLETGSNLMGKK